MATYSETNKATVSVSATPAHAGTVTGDGSYDIGTTATLTATPLDGWKFKQWSDGNTENPRTVTVTGDAAYTAQFERKTYTVSVSASPAEGGTVTGGGVYVQGKTVYLEAIPNEGYKAVGWSNGMGGSVYSFQVHEDTELIAYFKKETGIFIGTQRVTAYCGTQKISAYSGK